MSSNFTNNIDNVMKKIKKESERLSGQVSFEVLFNSTFMKKYTQFNSFEELLKAGGYVVNSKEDFEAIPDKEFDQHIAKYTKFNSWEEMYSKSGEEYFIQNLNL